MPTTFYQGKNIWVFKPVDYNRGRGVNIFVEFKQLNDLIMDSYINGVIDLPLISTTARTNQESDII